MPAAATAAAPMREALADVTAAVAAVGQQDQARLRAIARALADGKPSEPRETAKLLGRLGLTPGDLQQRVALALRRREAAKKLAGEAALLAQQAELTAAINESIKKIQEVQRAEGQRVQELRPLLAEVEAKLASFAATRQFLAASCDDPALLAREAEVSEQLGHIEREMARLRITVGLKDDGSDYPQMTDCYFRRIEALEQRIAGGQAEAKRFRAELPERAAIDRDVAEWQRQVEGYRQAIDEGRARYAELLSQAAPLKGELAEIRAEKLQA